MQVIHKSHSKISFTEYLIPGLKHLSWKCEDEEGEEGSEVEEEEGC